MKANAKKKVFNIIMIALIALIVVCGIMITGKIQGWFGGSGESAIVSSEVTGVANMERSGVGYTLKEDVSMEVNDIVETKVDSSADFKLNSKNEIDLNANTEMTILACEKNRTELNIEKGEIFASVSEVPDAFTIGFGSNKATITGTVFSISQLKGSSQLNVYEGTVKVKAKDGTEKIIEAGEEILITKDKNDNVSISVSDLKVAELNDYIIEKLKVCDTEICFSKEKLEKVQADRDAEKKEEAKALEKDAIAIAEGNQGTNGKSEASGSSDYSSSGNIMTCTISIKCTTLLSRRDQLKAGKDRYVPSNGVILAASPVEFNKGDTAYDVTKRACTAAGIQMEASYSGVYGSYYVEGINHLYEFDCGNSSGWLYKVNGWAPNYGCSEYKLKNGDSIVWSYTCSGN